MAVKLYNFSGLPDEPLRTLLSRAKRLVDCRGDVVVKVTCGGNRVSSHASRCDWVAKFHLAGRACTKASGRTELRRGKVRTAGGMVTLRPYHPPAFALRNPGWHSDLKDPIEWAKRLFETAMHEFHHIREFQERLLFQEWSTRNRGGKLPAWRYRPEEIRAMNATDEALEKLRRSQAKHDELILELAIQMEARWLTPAIQQGRGKIVNIVRKDEA